MKISVSISSLSLQLINLILLISGTFVETTAALILLVPRIISILPALDIDLIHLDIIVVRNLAIGMLALPWVSALSSREQSHENISEPTTVVSCPFYLF